MPSAFRIAFYALLALLLAAQPGQDRLPAGESLLPRGQAGRDEATLLAECEYWISIGQWGMYYDCLRRHRQAREREEAVRAQERERRRQERLDRERREREEAARLEEERQEEERLAREQERQSGGRGTDPLFPGQSDPFASPEPEPFDGSDGNGSDDEDECEEREDG